MDHNDMLASRGRHHNVHNCDCSRPKIQLKTVDVLTHYQCCLVSVLLIAKNTPSVIIARFVQFRQNYRSSERSCPDECCVPT